MELNKCGCGCGSLIELIGVVSDPGSDVFEVKCQNINCGCKIIHVGTFESAAAAWNTAHPKAVRLDDVREMVEDFSVRAAMGDAGEVMYNDLFDKLTAYVEGKNG